MMNARRRGSNNNMVVAVLLVMTMLLQNVCPVTCFQNTQHPPSVALSATTLHLVPAAPPKNAVTSPRKKVLSFVASVALMGAICLAPPLVVHADEVGVDNEAPTMFTGETVMICTKRGPLGKCTQTIKRTTENDNDKSETYFANNDMIARNDDPLSSKYELKRANSLAAEAKADQDNVLIKNLIQKSEDNKEKNDQTVLTRTQLNDEGASFGPFSKQTVILNADGVGFTLLENPQAMRLKKAGFINDKKQFIKQPTQQELDDAMPAEEEPNIFTKLLFGDEPL